MPGLGSSRKLLIQKGKIVNNWLYVYLLLAVYIGFLFLPVIQLIYSIGGMLKLKMLTTVVLLGVLFGEKVSPLLHTAKKT